jgi:DNA-nicking Smr family endonuclease
VSGGGDGDSKDSFTDALDRMGDVEPLGDRDKRARPPGSGARPAPARSPMRFEHPDPGEPGLGVASGIAAAQLRRLRGGRVRPDRVVDLHALRAEPARALLHDEIHSAAGNGERCVLVVHGKGLRSKGKPVLRSSLPDWLADPELENRVLAFAPAQPEDGGSGATYVLLRRTRT